MEEKDADRLAWKRIFKKDPPVSNEQTAHFPIELILSMGREELASAIAQTLGVQTVDTITLQHYSFMGKPGARNVFLRQKRFRLSHPSAVYVPAPDILVLLGGRKTNIITVSGAEYELDRKREIATTIYYKWTRDAAGHK